MYFRIFECKLGSMRDILIRFHIFRKTGEETDERIDLVRYLLKHEARVICRDDNGLTPLMLAAGRGFRAICELLINHESGDSYDRSVQ